MTSTLNPYLSFRDNAREAMEHYRDVLGGSLELNTFGEFGDPGQPGADLVMHASLTTEDGMVLMASDSPPGMDWSEPAGFSVSLSGDDADRLRGVWEGLSGGGTVTMPLEKQMWGDEFGMLVDRFGVPWMVNITAAG